MGQCSAVSFVIPDRGGCQHVDVLKGTAPAPSSSHRRSGGGGGEASMLSRPEGVAGAATAMWQALHLAYEAGPCATYGVPAPLGPADAHLGWWSHQQQV